MNTFTLVDLWWCCVVPQHRLIIQLLASAFALLQPFVEKATLDSAVQLYPGVSDEYRTGMLIEQLGMEPGVFVDPDGNQRDVYYFKLPVWLEYSSFLLTPPAVCTKRCKLQTFPD